MGGRVQGRKVHPLLNLRRARVVMAVVVASGAVVGCRPGAEAIPMTVVVERLGDSRFVVRVPICTGQRIGGFEVSWDGGGIETRWADDTPGRERVADFEISTSTLRSGSFNPKEVAVVSRTGSPPHDLAGVNVYVSAGGFAEWTLGSMPEGADLVRVAGHEPPRRAPAMSSRQLLRDQCP